VGRVGLNEGWGGGGGGGGGIGLYGSERGCVCVLTMHAHCSQMIIAKKCFQIFKLFCVKDQHYTQDQYACL